MFVQVFEGPTSDAAGLRRQFDRWESELMPGATGFLGSTSGVTKDGQFVAIARFADADAARRNSERPQQGEWWAETEKFFSGPVTFRESTDVEELAGGGSDSAGFVQVMQGKLVDERRARELEAAAMPHLETFRPDLIGSVRAIFDTGEFVEFAYFTSEAEARAGEAKEMPPELAANFDEWQQVLHMDRYLDLSDPWMTSPTS